MVELAEPSARSSGSVELQTKFASGGRRRVRVQRTRPLTVIVIRENPASRGTETSAEVLVGPPGRMVSKAGPQGRSTEK